jgi:hypothetical protein
MKDIIQASEFVFTPSSFVCAYIEQKTPSETIVETSAFGAIDRDIQPKTISNLLKEERLNLVEKSGGDSLNLPSGQTKSISGLNYVSTDSNIGGLGVTSGTIQNGINERMENVASISGTVQDIAGQEYNEAAKTDTKTIVKTVEEIATVVLVLTYGEYRAKCNNPQSTLNSIYTQVLAYYNSLT